MSAQNITIKPEEISLLLDYIKEYIIAHDSLEIEEDYYWSITGKETYDVAKNHPDASIGSLHDDWAELQKLITDDESIISALDLDRMAAILSAISQKITPI